MARYLRVLLVGPLLRDTKDGAIGVNGTYSTRLFTRYAIDAIHSHFGATGMEGGSLSNSLVQDASPMYLYLAHEAVHDASGSGIQAPLETVALYDDIYTNDTYKVMAAAVTELDYGIGNLTAALEAVGVWGNSVLIFTTDNGGPLGHSRNAPLRGGKHSYWEGGVRGESFVYSELIPSGRRGTTAGWLAHACDWYSTIVQGIAGLTLPEQTGPVQLDSLNLWPALLDEKIDGPREEVVIQAADPAVYNTSTAIRVSSLVCMMCAYTGCCTTRLINGFFGF